MKLNVSVLLGLTFQFYLSNNAVAACDISELKFLQGAGYSVSDAIKWCKGTSTTITATPTVAAATPPVLARATASTASPPAPSAMVTAQAKTDKPAVLERPTIPEKDDASKRDQAATVNATNNASVPDKGITPTASAFLKGWGVGLAFIQNRSPIVSDAIIVNGVVRATTVQNYQTELIFGSHWYLQGANDHECGRILGKFLQGAGCLGIFLGVGVGGSNSASQLIDFVGTGLLWGFGDVQNADGTRDPQAKKHSIGIGIGRRFNVKHLGEGFAPNQPLPAGETQIRYDVRDTVAPYLFYTYNF